MSKSKAFVPSVVILTLLVCMGLAAWVYQLVNGLAVTGMNNATSWGIYIACFMLLVGLSAGGLIVASSASVFGIKKYKAIAKPAVLLSTVCIVLAVAFVLVDMGGVQRAYLLFISPNFMSPLMWDIVIISIYLIINIVYLVLMSRKELNEKLIKRVSCVALPVAILVHSVTAWIFGLEITREGWHTSLMAPLFVASALDSGLALLVIALAALNKLNVFKIEKKLLVSLAGLLATCVAIDLFFVGCEVLTLAYPGTDAGNALLAEMFTGSTALFFWGEIILGFAIPLGILLSSKGREKTGLVLFASACVIVGVFFKRIWLLLTSFVHFGIAGAPGITSGSLTSPDAPSSMWELAGAYAPTAIEIAIVVGVFAAGGLAYTLLATKLLKQDQATVSGDEDDAQEVAVPAAEPAS